MNAVSCFSCAKSKSAPFDSAQGATSRWLNGHVLSEAEVAEASIAEASKMRPTRL